MAETVYTDSGVANSITARIEMIRNGMDQIVKKEALTNGMTASQVLQDAFSNAKTAKIPTMDVSAAGNYDKVKGYAKGKVGIDYNEYTLQFDRGISLSIDALDTVQSGGIAEVATAAAEFMRLYMVPEIDATRISQAVAKTKTAMASHVLEESAKPTAANIISKIGDGLDAIFEERGIDSGATIYINNNLKSVLRASTEVTKVRAVDGSMRQLDLTTQSIDGNQIVFVPSARMKTAYDYGTPDGDGVGGGFTPSESATDINFLIAVPGAAQGVVALQRPKYFTADENQNADSAIFQFRICHDLIVEKNSGASGIYASVMAASSRPDDGDDSGEQTTPTTKATK